MNKEELKHILEAGIHAAAKPMNLAALTKLFDEENPPEADALREALEELQQDYVGHAVELAEVSSGFRFQVKPDYMPWVSRLWEEKPPKYSRAVLETLALIAYRQPITRGEIEEIRGVSVSTHIIKSMMEREWIRSVGQRDVPGRPTLYATTKMFLDYFNLKSLDELPSLAELNDLDAMADSLDEASEHQAENPQTELAIDDQAEAEATEAAADSQGETESIATEDAVAEADSETDDASVSNEEDEEEALLHADTEAEVAEAIARASALDEKVEALEDQFADTVSFDDESADAETDLEQVAQAESETEAELTDVDAHFDSSIDPHVDSEESEASQAEGAATDPADAMLDEMLDAQETEAFDVSAEDAQVTDTSEAEESAQAELTETDAEAVVQGDANAPADMTFETIMQNMLARESESEVSVSHDDETRAEDREQLMEVVDAHTDASPQMSPELSAVDADAVSDTEAVTADEIAADDTASDRPEDPQ